MDLARVSAVSETAPRAREVQHMVRAELFGPFGLQPGQSVAQNSALVEFDAVALAVIEAERLDALVTLQSPGQACGGILPAGKQNQGHKSPS